MLLLLPTQDICDGNKKLNTSMVAQLFNTCHGLEFESERKRMSLVDISALNIDDAGDSRWDSFFSFLFFFNIMFDIRCEGV